MVLIGVHYGAVTALYNGDYRLQLKETSKLGIDNIFGVVILYLVSYMLMNVMLYSGCLKNVPLAQLKFKTQFSTNYNPAFAYYLLALIPILVFYVLCQKQIIGGIANGAVKG